MTSSPRILLVANTGWYLYNFRSALARRLAQEGFDVGMVFPNDEFTASIEASGFHTIQWDVDRKATTPWYELVSVKQLMQIYRKEKPALVHHFTIKPVAYGSLAARMSGVPSVINSVTGRGYVFMGPNEKTAHLRRLIGWILKLGYARRNIATTFENKSDMAFFIETGMISEHNVFLINGVGVDTQQFFYAPEPPEEPAVIVFPGRLLWAKGVGTLVEAARMLKARLPVRVVLVGKPDPGNPESINEAIIQEWVNQGIVEWWGWQADMCAVYHRCHIVVLPSMGEGLSKALLEAASCGRPIVATDVPGCREVVVPGVTGYLVPTDNPQLLTEKIERLIRDPGLRLQMGQSGRRLIEENYADTLVNEQILTIYRSLLQSKSSG
jgi:glycosyltransferase involved in cell wall biosynthesis